MKLTGFCYSIRWHLIIHQPYSSLILRSSYCPVFDRLQYAKIEGKGLHSPFYRVNDVIPQCLTTGRQRGRQCICAHVHSEQELVLSI